MAENLNIISGSKEEQYASLLPQIKSLIEGETDLIANLANVTAALKETFHFFWVGFYLVKEDELVLAPFQGPIACTRIRKGKGVCGTAWREKRTLVIPDVDAFPGHIACSSLSRSEIVVPLMKEGEVWGVLDIDSELLGMFDENFAAIYESIVKIVIFYLKSFQIILIFALSILNKESITGETCKKSSIIPSVADAIYCVSGEHYDVYPCTLCKWSHGSTFSPQSWQTYPL